MKIIGASFFPPCHNDDLDYTFVVTEVSKEKKTKVAKLFSMSVKDLLIALREKGEITRTCKLMEAEEIYIGLMDMEIKFAISPNLIKKYPNLIGYDCF